MLEMENTKMEAQLKQVQQLMELDKQKRQQPAANQAKQTLWRSATQNQSLRGYDRQVMDHVTKTKNLPPR